jgi:hypothetical protein
VEELSEPVYRHEYKYTVTQAECEMLKNRLGQVMIPDPYAVDGQYVIRSLYFDNYRNTALAEKVEGTDPRAKFRIRIYNGSDAVITLEKKVKQRDLTQKLREKLTRAECDRILCGDIDWMIDDRRALVVELYARMKADLLRPKTLVEYTRIPFVYEAGNVRVTLDCDIRTGVYSTDLFSPEPLVPAGELNVLEVKFDRFLPDIIRYLISPVSKVRESFSKYEASRKFG